MVSPQGLRSAWLLVPWRHAYDPPDCCVCWKQFHSSPRREVRPLPGVAQPTVQVTAPSWSPPPPAPVVRGQRGPPSSPPRSTVECRVWALGSGLPPCVPRVLLYKKIAELPVTVQNVICGTPGRVDSAQPSPPLPYPHTESFPSPVPGGVEKARSRAEAQKPKLGCFKDG